MWRVKYVTLGDKLALLGELEDQDLACAFFRCVLRYDQPILLVAALVVRCPLWQP